MATHHTILILFPILSLLLEPTRADGGKNIFCMHLASSVNRQGEGNFKVEYIDEKLCTHLIYCYVGIEDNGTVVSLNKILDFDKSGKGNIRKFNNKKHYNKNLKTMVAVGGWDESEKSKRYSNIFSDEANQVQFVESATEFVLKNNFDGLALHWAYPGVFGGDAAIDKVSFDQLLAKLYAALSQRNLTLTVICHGLTWGIDDSYNVASVSRNVDYILLTSYDFYGSDYSEHIGLAGGLYLHPKETDRGLSTDSVIQNWLERGASPEKLIMGIPFFGRIFKLKNENQTDPGSSFIGTKKSQYILNPGFITYMELCEKFQSEQWTQKWENTQKGPYAFKADEWICYENARSLELKSKYVLSRDLAGVAPVFIEDDDFKGTCGTKYQLLKLLNAYLRSSGSSDSEYDYILNISVFKKSRKDGYSQCIYHSVDQLNIN